MTLPTFEDLLRYRYWIAGAAIAISAITWISELAGWVYVCPYCRTQRTVIGLIGLLLLFPRPDHWITRWIGSTLAALGLVVGATQHFNGWKKIMSGEFKWGEHWYINAWMLSGFALFIITGLLLYMWGWRTPQRTEAETA